MNACRHAGMPCRSNRRRLTSQRAVCLCHSHSVSVCAEALSLEIRERARVLSHAFEEEEAEGVCELSVQHYLRRRS